MTTIKHAVFVVIAVLLLGLSLTLGGGLFLSQTVRADPACCTLPRRRWAPALPAWLALADNDNGTAMLSGAPPNAGEYQVVLRATDSAGAFAEQSFSIAVAEKPPDDLFLPLVLGNGP